MPTDISEILKTLDLSQYPYLALAGWLVVVAITKAFQNTPKYQAFIQGFEHLLTLAIIVFAGVLLKAFEGAYTNVGWVSHIIYLILSSIMASSAHKVFIKDTAKALEEKRVNNFLDRQIKEAEAYKASKIEENYISNVLETAEKTNTLPEIDLDKALSDEIPVIESVDISTEAISNVGVVQKRQGKIVN